MQNGGDAAYTSSVTASPRHLLPLEKAFVPLPRWTDGGFIVIPSRWFGGRSKPLPYVRDPIYTVGRGLAPAAAKAPSGRELREAVREPA